MRIRNRNLKDILTSSKVQELECSFKNHESVLIEDLWNAPKALVAALASEATGKHVLILTGASQEEVRLYQDFAFFTNNPVVDFPAWETLPSENIAPSPDIVGERYRALHELSTSNKPHIILSSLQACLQKLIIPKNFENLYLILEKEKSYPFDALIEKLNKMGYERCSIASDKGQYALRGGIIDIFPVSSPDPYRLEFWEDDLESLRIYDPISQKSVKQAESLEITPAQEMELIDKASSLGTILDYLGPNTIVVFDDLLAL
jgi:transcription-repair coupling factor (superfamily II helicase)